jgi:hypothetical protein
MLSHAGCGIEGQLNEATVLGYVVLLGRSISVVLCSKCGNIPFFTHELIRGIVKVCMDS